MTTIRNDFNINESKKLQKFSLHRSSSSALAHRGHKQNEELGIKQEYNHSWALTLLAQFLLRRKKENGFSETAIQTNINNYKLMTVRSDFNGNLFQTCYDISNINYFIIENIYSTVMANLPLILNLLSQLYQSYNKGVIV